MKSIKSNFDLLKVIFLFVFILAAVNLFSQEKEDLLYRKISIDAEDAAVSHIISTMAKLSDCNIVLAIDTATEKGEAEERRVTIHLKDVPIEQALALVVKSIGLSYRLIGDKTFLVGEKALIDEEIGERSYIVNLNYLDVKKVVAALEIMPGMAVAIEGQNAILLRANPETYAEIIKRIQEIDVPQKQIEIRVRLIEISTREAEKLGIDWSRLNKFTTILAEDPVNAGGVGLPYSFTDVTGALPFGSAENFEELPEDQYFQKMTDWNDVFNFSRQLTAFDITLDMLLQNNAAQLLTDTRITALNGEEAEIHIGEIVPFVVTDKEYQIQVEREEVGIILRVLPTVNKDGHITTRIEPEVSSVMELVGGYIPRTKVRKILTTVTVPDGHRIVVGGLLHSSIITSMNKVPLLSSIPFIGKLFQHKEEIVNNTDLIIEITPRVVDFTKESINFELDKRLERKLIKEEEKEE